MKKNNIKKVVLSIVLTIVIVLSVVAVGVVKKDKTNNLKETEDTVVESSQNEIVNATEKKEQKTTEKATEEKSTSAKVEKPTETQVDAPVAETTKNVVPTTQASKPVATTKPVETTKKPATTKPAKPTTTKANKDEYYPALTASDMEYLKKYAADYIKSKGYTHNPDLDWDNCGYSSTVGMSYNLAVYGDKYKRDGGISPLEWAKRDVKEGIDCCIEDFGDTPWLEMTLLVEIDNYGCSWAVGYMA